MKNKEAQKPNHAVRIGFDFDKVFVNLPPLVPDELINWIYKKKSKTLRYRMPGKYEQKIRILSHYPIFRHPVTDNIDALKKLHKKDYELYLISGRLGFLDRRTEHWMKKFSMKKYFKEIYFNFDNKQSHYFKDEIIKSLKITHFIDDDLELLYYLAKNNPNVSFYWLHNHPLSKNSIPFKNIQQIQKISDIPNL